MKKTILISILIIVSGLICAFTSQDYKVEESRFVIHKVDPCYQKLKLYWKDDNGKIFGSIENLKTSLAERKEILVFAMNGGMYNKDQSPQGLYIENGNTVGQIDLRDR